MSQTKHARVPAVYPVSSLAVPSSTLSMGSRIGMVLFRWAEVVCARLQLPFLAGMKCTCRVMRCDMGRAVSNKRGRKISFLFFFWFRCRQVLDSNAPEGQWGDWAPLTPTQVLRSATGTRAARLALGSSRFVALGYAEAPGLLALPRDRELIVPPNRPPRSILSEFPTAQRRGRTKQLGEANQGEPSALHGPCT